MTSQRPSLSRPGSFVAGSLLGLSAVTPVFAATLDGPLPPQDLLLYGSLVLLTVGLAARLMRGHTPANAGVAEDVPDMRWWRDAEPQM
ncbi:MAG: hypothetical protein ABI593_13245 [Betaproteobacteria bacterium]